MGIVYKGYDPNIGRVVAIKTVQLGAGTIATDLLKRFRREAQAAGVLSHPHIVTIYDAGEDQGVFYIAMEYVEGHTLEKIIAQQGPMPLDVVTTIVEDVGSALDHAHHREIIHRDIKPANIMIANGRAKVMDFGVAKLSSSTATASGTVIGTPSYMSPEGVKGMPVDGRADIFSLGVVLYEMLTHKRPFAGDNIPSVIYKIIGAQPAPPSVVNPHLHPGLNVVLFKALSKEPEARYQTCAELTHDLRNFHSLKMPVVDPNATAAAVSPSIDHTLAPPFVSGTVAMDNKTMGIPAPPASNPITPPTVAIRPPSSSPLVKIAAAVVLFALFAATGLLWKNHRSQVARDAESRRDAVAATQNQTALDKSKPSPMSTSGNATPGNGAVNAATPATPLAPGDAAARDVMVKANVEGASIKVDGKGRADWLTPKQIKIPLGDHRIEVAKVGYKSAAQNASVSADGPANLDFTLAALAREIEIVTTPPGAQVNVDGSDQDALTPARYSIPFGPHTIQVRKAGFRSESRTVQVDAATDGVTMTLQKEGGEGLGRFFGRRAEARAEGRIEGRVRVRTIPQGAEIQVDGASTDYRSPINFLLPAGPHKITVTHRGVQPVTRDVEVKAGQMTDIEIDMLGGAIRKRQ